MSSEGKVALVTGASSGIGEATARALHEAGYVTYATARRPESLSNLAARGISTLGLDVTDEESMVAAVATIERERGAVEVLVNNAGYGPLGAIEEFSRDEWQRLFDTNVIGMARLTALVLPGMRRHGGGRIINVGSMGGEFTTPLGGAYHGSKYAVEALTDALRVEVAPFGVQVALVQPGPVKTPMARAGGELRPAADSPYAVPLTTLAEATRRAYASGRGFVGPEDVAKVIVAAAGARRPRDRYKVGAVAHLLPLLRRSLPIGTWDRMQARQTGFTELRSGAGSTRRPDTATRPATGSPRTSAASATRRPLSARSPR